MRPGSPALELVDISLTSFDIAVLVVAIQEGGRNSVLAWCVLGCVMYNLPRSIALYLHAGAVEGAPQVRPMRPLLVQGFENITPCRDTYSLLRRSL